MAVVLKSPDEIKIMRQAGRHVAEVLHILADTVRPGVVVAELDHIVREEFKRRGVIPTFLGYHPEMPPHERFPATVCVSINDQIVHGIPGSRVLQDGDIVSIDLGCTYRGYVGDSAVTVPCGNVSPEARQLIDVTRESLCRGIAAARIGNKLGDIGHAVESYARPYGYGVVREYVGHGVGRDMHEEPNVPNHGEPGKGRTIKNGLVIAIEPMLNLGTHETQKDADGWTIWTKDGSLSAHFEHTIAITRDGPMILTLP